MKRSSINLKKNALQRVYLQFSVKGFKELEKLYVEADQKLMYAGEWDYKNSKLLPNQIKRSLEKIPLVGIKNTAERKTIQNLVWFWYHHAISCALWRYGDRDIALIYSAKAIELQLPDHSNRITRLLFLLLRDNLIEAEEWYRVTPTGPEKTTAMHLLEFYRSGHFFDKQVEK